jgi:hypothetical protein
MRSDPIEYRLCRRCGHVWVERAAAEGATSEEPRRRQGVTTRIAEAALTLLRFLTPRSV